MKTLLLTSLLLFVTPATSFAADPTKSRIVTYKSNVARCLAPVEIYQIDGHLRQLPTTGFEMEPGIHTMRGTVTANTATCPVAKEGSKRPPHIPPLDWYFEPGKVYYVGFDHSSTNREDWRFVVWKVEYEDGEVIFDITKKETEISQ